jgi:hypothetical protein
MFETNTDNKLLESGIKIIAEEDRAVYEHITEGSHEGKKYQTLALCILNLKEINSTSQNYLLSLVSG